ncbi:MAG: hypothetical protein JNM41_09095 [Flavipsychrobacter sp.]|nr:hypothetical protein [Flavipsychrobacter sp.]
MALSFASETLAGEGTKRDVSTSGLSFKGSGSSYGAWNTQPNKLLQS